MSSDQAIQSVTEKLALLRQMLNKEGKFPGGPIRRKLLSVLHEDLSEIRGELEAQENTSNYTPPYVTPKLKELLDFIHPGISVEVAWYVKDQLTAVIPSLARDQYVFGKLSCEKKPDPNTRPRWDDRYDPAELGQLVGEYQVENGHFNPGKRHLAEIRLENLYKERNDQGLHDRTSAAMRVNYLRAVSYILLSLLILLAAIIQWPPGGKSLQLLLVLFAGALGAALSLAIRLRDLERIQELKEVYGTLIAQMVIGATLAAIVFFILHTGLVTIAGFDPSHLSVEEIIVLAFVTGFSEPFAIGTLERISGVHRQDSK